MRSRRVTNREQLPLAAIALCLVLLVSLFVGDSWREVLSAIIAVAYIGGIRVLYVRKRRASR